VLSGEDVERSLARADAATALCFVDRDRQHLLAVIEASGHALTRAVWHVARMLSKVQTRAV